MRKTFRFLARPMAQVLGIYAAFAVFIFGGCWLTGSRDGLFGGYAEMLPMFAAMFGIMMVLSLDTYCDVALCMGASRRDCYWSMQLCSLINAVFLTAMMAIIQRAVLVFPTEDADWYMLEPKGLALMLLICLTMGEAGIVANRVSSVNRRAVVLVVSIISGAACGMVTFFSLAMREEFEKSPVGRFVLQYAPMVFLAALVVLAVLGWNKYRKAVVRA